MNVATAPPADTNFLLSLQVLLDLCGTGSNPAREWAGNPVLAARLRVSVLTVAVAHAGVSGCPDAQKRGRLAARLAALLAELRANGGTPLSFDESSARVWQSYMFEPTLGVLSQVDRQFYASAFSAGLCVVEYEHLHTAALGPLGVTVLNLGVRP